MCFSIIFWKSMFWVNAVILGIYFLMSFACRSKTAPRPPKTAPRPPQDRPRGPQDPPGALQDPPRSAPMQHGARFFQKKRFPCSMALVLVPLVADFSENPQGFFILLIKLSFWANDFPKSWRLGGPFFFFFCFFFLFFEKIVTIKLYKWFSQLL